MCLVTFINRGAIFIEWNEYATPQELLERFYDILRLNKHWTYDRSFIIPRTGIGNINDWIDELSCIVSFLQKENIPWKGCKTSFREEIEPALLIIKGYTANIIRVSYELDISVETFPLGTPQKIP